MFTKINEPVSVVTIHTPQKGLTPYGLTWRQRPYRITKIGLHHKKLRGSTIHHIYTCATNTLALTLDYNTDSLQWTLKDISDTQPD